MKNNFAKMLKEAKRTGVQNGLLTMQFINLIACYNELPDFMDEEKIAAACMAIEKESQRIWLEECHENAEEAGALIVGHALEIREKLGMEEYEK